eukprot:jgi/Mesen1/9418/ME000614S08675
MAARFLPRPLRASRRNSALAGALAQLPFAGPRSREGAGGPGGWGDRGRAATWRTFAGAAAAAAVPGEALCACRGRARSGGAGGQDRCRSGASLDPGSGRAPGPGGGR